MRRLVLTAAVAALLIAGCSKTEQTASTAGTSTTPATTPATDAPTTTAKEMPATTAKKRATTTTGGDGPTTSAEPRNPDSDYCAEAEKTVATFEDGNELNPIDDAAKFSAFLGDATTAAENMAAVAPDDIKAEWEAIAEAFGKLAAVPPDQLMTEMTKMGDELDQAGEAIDAFTLAECGFDLNGESGSGSTGEAPDDTGAAAESTEK